MDSYSIWLLEYGSIDQFAMSSVVYGKHNQGVLHIPFTFLVLKGNGHTIAVDTGYYDEGYGCEMTKNFGITAIRPIEKALADIGLRGEDFDTVIITHAHYDHMGGIKAFPNARFYMQKKELLDSIEAMALPEQFDFVSGAINPYDIKDVMDLIIEKRLVLFEGQVPDLLPGINLVPIFNSHTYGLQLVTIQKGPDKKDGNWVFTSDVCYSFENFGNNPETGPYLPVGYGLGSISEMIKALSIIWELSEHHLDRLIIPHEPKMWQSFPSKIISDNMHIAEIQLSGSEKSWIK